MIISMSISRKRWKWTAIERLLSKSLKEDPTYKRGKLVNIARRDKGCNYQAPGEYLLFYVSQSGEDVQVNLTVNPVK